MAIPTTEWLLEDPDDARLRPVGILDGNFEFARLTARPLRRLLVDLAGVRHANSSLIVPWLRCFRELHDRGTEVRYANLPDALIPTFNTIEGFACGGRVISVIAPFYCRKCAVCWDVPLATPTLAEAIDAAGRQSCRSCRKPVQLDEDPEGFFGFLEARDEGRAPRRG